jgi:hypothetical protein
MFFWNAPIAKYPGTFLHHVLAVAIGVAALVEPQWHTSALFHAPWLVHAAAFANLLLVNGSNFSRGPLSVFFVVYNIALAIVCGVGWVAGCRDGWQRFSPLVPVAGLCMAAANYQQYCTEMHGWHCLPMLDEGWGSMLYVWLLVGWHAAVVGVGCMTHPWFKSRLWANPGQLNVAHKCKAL